MPELGVDISSPGCAGHSVFLLQYSFTTPFKIIIVNEYLMITSVKGTTRPHFIASPQVTPGLWDLDINLDVFLSEDSQEGDCDPDQWEEEE